MLATRTWGRHENGCVKTQGFEIWCVESSKECGPSGGEEESARVSIKTGKEDLSAGIMMEGFKSMLRSCL